MKYNEKHAETVLVIVTGLIAVYFLTGRTGFLTAGLIVGLLGTFSTFIRAKIHWAWMKLAEVMGSIMSPLILGIVFFVFLFPLAILSRVFRKKDELNLKGGNTDSFFVERNHEYGPKDIVNPW